MVKYVNGFETLTLSKNLRHFSFVAVFSWWHETTTLMRIDPQRTYEQLLMLSKIPSYKDIQRIIRFGKETNRIVTHNSNNFSLGLH